LSPRPLTFTGQRNEKEPYRAARRDRQRQDESQESVELWKPKEESVSRRGPKPHQLRPRW